MPKHCFICDVKTNKVFERKRGSTGPIVSVCKKCNEGMGIMNVTSIDGYYKSLSSVDHKDVTPYGAQKKP